MRRVRRERLRPLAAVAVVLGGASGVLAPTLWWAVGLACVPLLVVALVAVLPVRLVEWDVVLAAGARDVVHCEQFTDQVQRRRAGRLCVHFDAVRRAVRGLEARRVAQVERLLWRALVALRDSLAVRDALRSAENRPGLAAAIAEPTRELAELDRRLDQFEAALRIVVEELDPELAASALRRVAALDPL
ncbi:hypothetical protein ALI22I_12455 [Saccharothrix sp. ALI-22-I]|nr:hypothetical protein ALI22I_12455 [Saccharothrix sp. ALI-22-I]